VKVKNMRQESNECWKFDLDVGGFTIRRCRWYPGSRQILFPKRCARATGSHFPVVFAHGAQVARLRDLVESGQFEAPRNRQPCILKIRLITEANDGCPQWMIFNFTVRGFHIIGCRWQPATGSIQLPVTYVFNENRIPYIKVKMRVVCAYGAHINRLRAALEEELGDGIHKYLRQRPAQAA